MIFLYHYDSNTILIRPLKNRSDEEKLKVYEDFYEFLQAQNYSPKIYILDNGSSKALEQIFTKNKYNYQLVEPENHRINAAEKEIQAGKNNLYLGLASVHPKFQSYLWDELIPKMELALNLLPCSRTWQKILEHTHLYDPFDFLSTPLSPQDTPETIYNDPKHWKTHVFHGTHAFYVGPNPEHYCCYQFYIPSTGGSKPYRTSEIFPHMLDNPKITPINALLIAAKELTEVLMKLLLLFITTFQNKRVMALKNMTFFTIIYKHQTHWNIIMIMNRSKIPHLF